VILGEVSGLGFEGFFIFGQKEAHGFVSGEKRPTFKSYS